MMVRQYSEKSYCHFCYISASLSQYIGGKSMKHILAGLTVVICAFVVVSTGYAQDYRKLYTQWKGAGMPLDVFNGGQFNNFVHLATNGNYSGQQWMITSDGTWRHLTTQFRGSGMCLDVVNGGSLNNFVQLAPCGNYSGQFWNFRKDGGWYRLTTQFRGNGMCLDIFNGGPYDGMAHLAKCAAYTGQLWQLSQRID
jgi:hypothetical protein